MPSAFIDSVAIPPYDANKPEAYRRLRRNFATGGTKIEFVDENGNIVPFSETRQYNMIDPMTMDIKNLGLDPMDQVEPVDDDNNDENDPTPEVDTSNQFDPTTVPRGADRDPREFDGSAAASSRSEANNYGYVDRPDWLSMTSFAPGIVGTASKVASAAMNANNVAATNSARQASGLPELSAKEMLGGFMKDRNGYVADASITNALGEENQYSIGLEAQDKWGRTTLTPNEARQRSLANPNNISLAQRPTDLKKEKHGIGGLISGVSSNIRSFIDSIFNGDDIDENSFPDAPSPSNSFADYDHPDRGELSDAARDAVDRGRGGLY